MPKTDSKTLQKYHTILSIDDLEKNKHILHKNTEINDTKKAQSDLLRFWKKSKSIRKRDLDLYNLARLTFINRAGLINNYKGHKSNAIKCFTLITERSIQTKYPEFINFLKCAAEINSGVVYFQLNIFWKSLNHFASAKDILRKHLNSEIRLKVQLNTNLGNLYQLIDKEKSLKIFLETIDLIKQEPISIETARVYYNAGLACSAIGDFNTAHTFLLKSISHYEHLNSNRGLIISKIGLLNLLTKFNQRDQSSRLIQEVSKNNIEDPLENEYKVFQKIAIGNYFLSTKDYSKAKEYFELSISINKTNATKAEILQVLKSLSEIYEMQGDYQKAFETMKQKDALHEELFGEEKLRLFRNIEQQQEEMLQKEKAMELEQKVRQLEHAALLSQMNPHFIFNSLNTLQNLVIEGNEAAAIHFISEFSTLMREMLNNAKEELIPLKNEIEFLTRYVQLEEIRFSNQFNFVCTVDNVLPKHLVKIPVMLIQPLLENAIRHGLAPSKSAKSLHLNVLNGGPFIIVEVIDNGIGWKEKINKDHKSHALDNIQERLSLMRAPNQEYGRMEIASTPSTGTKITLWIPVQF